MFKIFSISECSPLESGRSAWENKWAIGIDYFKNRNNLGGYKHFIEFFCFNSVGLIDFFSCFAMKIIKKCAKFSTHNLKNFNQTKT